MTAVAPETAILTDDHPRERTQEARPTQLRARAGQTGRRVTIFGINYAPEPSGNAPYNTGLAEHLVKEGWHVEFVTGYPHYPAWKRQSAARRSTLGGVDVRRFRHFVPRSSSAAQRGLLEITSLLSALPSALRKSDADVVVGVVPNLSGAVLAQVAAWRNGVPSVLWFQDLMGPAAQQSGTTGGGIVAGLVGRIETAVALRASRIMLAAEGFRPHFESVGIESSTLVRARNWNLLPSPSLDAGAVRDAFGIGRDTVVALHSGNMGMKQGLEIVLDAAAIAPEIQFVLQGDGNARRDLEREARHRDLTNVLFLPSLSAADLANLLSAADVLLVTQRSTVSDMALPSKLASYAAAGVPVVASVDSESETAREVADAGIGQITAPGDPTALARAVRLAVRERGRLQPPNQRASSAILTPRLNPSLDLITELVEQAAAVPA